MTSGQLASLLGSIRNGLHRLYGERLRGVYLFGSYARDEADEGSDVDVIVVLDRVSHYAGELDRTSDLFGDLSLEHGVTVSSVFVSEHDWELAQTPFLLNVKEEAQPV